MCNCKKKSTAPVSNPSPPVSNAPAFPAFRLSHPKVPVKEMAREVEIDEIPGDTIAEKCRAFACLLGLADPVSEQVLIGAVDDASYARSLLANRTNENVLTELLSNPPSRMYDRLKRNNASFSNAVLIAKAGKSLLKWGASGFSTVSIYQLEVRENACLACPNLSEPESVLQMVTASPKIGTAVGHRTGNKICASCGCVLKNKMRLSTDTCPEEDLNNPGFNRWGEPHIPS